MKNCKHIHLESVDSTNNYARDLVLQQYADAKAGQAMMPHFPIVVTADAQTAGRGRFGHSFLSPASTGIYMSYAYQREYTEEELLGVTTRVAELILPVLQQHYSPSEGFKKELLIKPINDIYIGNPTDSDSRKVAGILTERIDYPDRSGYFIIVGIGINCTPFEVPDELKKTIGFLEPDCSMNQLIEEITDALSAL